jgi:putative chitinase
MITSDILAKIFPKTKKTIIDSFVQPFNDTMSKYAIDTPLRKAHFLAQVGHESGGLNFTMENLNYSADGLLKIFPKYFNAESAASHARNPQMIANRVYSNRMGNGDVASNEGWMYRGRGLIQLTGKANYSLYSIALNKPVADVIAFLETPAGAVDSAAWFWNKHNLNQVADKDDIRQITKIINGGVNGLDDRQHILDEAKKYVA